MSVINKMLRDLDSRQSGPAKSPFLQATPPEFTAGTVLATPLPSAVRANSGLRMALLVVTVTSLMLGVAAVWWYLYLKDPPALLAPQKMLSVAQAPSAQAVVAVVPVPVLAAKDPAPVSSSTLTPFKLTTASKPPPTSPSPIKALVPAPLASVPGQLPPEPQPQQQPPSPSPALDALAQSQSLWAAGSHSAALALLREALAVSERANVAGTPKPTTAVLASLARELARMEMAEGRVSQALALLTRLEPALSGQAEVWALRGNAAQRLGRHEESAQAYQRALQLRPNEPRWMLGAAVSLAALGQTESAAEFAENARQGGALSPDIAAYLKQLGVVLK